MESLSLRARIALVGQKKRKLIAIFMVSGAVLVLLGVWAGYSGGCFGNFAFGGVSCYLWGFSVPETVAYAIPWGLMLAGITVIVVSFLVGYAPWAYHPQSA